MYIYICVHIYVYEYIYVYIYMYMHIHTYIYIHIHTYIHIHAHTYTHIHIHTNTCINTHTHIYTYTNRGGRGVPGCQKRWRRSTCRGSSPRWSCQGNPHIYVFFAGGESCHTYECVVSHMRKSRTLPISWNTSKKLFLVYSVGVLCCTRKCVISPGCSNYVTHMNESCHAYEWVVSRIWMCDGAQKNVSCHAYECVMSHIWMCHATHMNVSCHTYECVVSHLRMCRVTHLNVWWHTYECVVSHIWMCHVTHTNVSCHTYECVMSHMNVSRHTYECAMSHICRSCAVRHTYEWGMSHIWMSYVARMHESRHAYECIMSQIWTSHVIHMKSYGAQTDESCHTYRWVMSHIWMSLVTHPPDPTIMYVPLQVNRSQKCILLIVQYKFIKSCSGDFYSPESDPPHKIMRYWVYYSTQLVFWISTWQNLWGGNDLYWRCTSFEKAFRRGRPLNILHDS